MDDGDYVANDNDDLLPIAPGRERFVHPGQITFVGDEAMILLGQTLGMKVAENPSQVLEAKALVMGVSSTETMKILHDIVRHRGERGVDAVIAWRLREEHMGGLYLLNVPVFVGLPTAEELLATLNAPFDEQQHLAQRQYAAGLALLESVFKLPAA